jgi:hypothetical protein
MTTSTTIPVTVTPEAATRIAELGFQAEVDRMLDHARQHLPEIVHIEVVLNERYDMGSEPGVAIEAYSRRPFNPDDRVSGKLGDWVVRSFPPEVLEHLHLSYYPGADHAG